MQFEPPSATVFVWLFRTHLGCEQNTDYTVYYRKHVELPAIPEAGDMIRVGDLEHPIATVRPCMVQDDYGLVIKVAPSDTPDRVVRRRIRAAGFELLLPRPRIPALKGSHGH